MIFDDYKIELIENQLGISISNKYITTLAFLHSSYINEVLKGTMIYELERLKILGSSLFTLIITDLGFFNINQNPGVLSQINYEIKSRGLLKKATIHYDLTKFCVFGKGAIKESAEYDELILPVLAAVYLQIGYEKTLKIIELIYISEINFCLENPITDWKTALQENIQRYKHTITYKTIRETGPDHDKVFTVEVCVLNKRAEGVGKSKKIAEQDAAKNFFILHIPKSEWKDHTSKFYLSKYINKNTILTNKRCSEIDFIKNTFTADTSLIHQSLVHRSYINENKFSKFEDYSIIACLGSAVQDFVYSEFIYTNYHELFQDNGQNEIVMKSYLMTKEFNADIADKLGISNYIILSKGEYKNGLKKSVKADALQALFGSVFINYKNKQTDIVFYMYSLFKRFLLKYILHACKSFNKINFDAKTELQECAQSFNWDISYDTVVSGPQHNPKFCCTAIIKNTNIFTEIGKGEGVSIKDASNNAAIDIYNRISNYLNMLSNLPIEERIYHKPFIIDFFVKLSSFRLTPSMLSTVLNICGGLGISELIFGNFLKAHKNLINTINTLEMISIDSEIYILPLIKKMSPYFASSQLNNNSIQKLLYELINWLKEDHNLSQKNRLNYFYNELIDNIQVFKMVTSESFESVSPADILSDLSLVIPRNISLSIDIKDNEAIFGQKQILSWIIYSLITKIEESRINRNNCLNLKICFQNDNSYEFAMEMVFNTSEFVEQGKLDEEINILRYYAGLCFAEISVENKIIKINFLKISTSYDTISSNNKTDHVFIELNNKIIKMINDLRPLAGIMHDLKNALMVFERSLVNYQKSGSNKYDNTFINSRKNCKKLAEGLLLYYSLSKPNYGYINIVEMSNEIKNEIKSLAGEKCRVDFALNIKKEEILTDSAMLHSIILNLAKNAVESIEKSGFINITFEIDRTNDLLIIIQDTGCGIPKDKIPTIFTSFRTSKEEKGGTGLGLPTVKRLIDSLGGIIEIQSEIGKGTTFSILLPISGIDLLTKL